MQKAVTELDRTVTQTASAKDLASKVGTRVALGAVSRRSGMTGAEKKQLGDIEESQARIDAMQKRINETLRNLRIDDLKSTVKTLKDTMPLKLDKGEIAAMKAQMLSDV